MEAFNGNSEQKDERLAQADEHIRLDMLRAGTYGNEELWIDTSPDQLHKKGFKACSLGCYYGPDSPHERCEELDGIPHEVAEMADDLFEALPLERRIRWHREWMEAIPVRADLFKVRIWHQFDYYNIHDPLKGVIASATDDVKELINKYHHLLYAAAYGDMPHSKDFREAAQEAQALEVQALEVRIAWEVRGAKRVQDAGATARRVRKAEAWEWEVRKGQATQQLVRKTQVAQEQADKFLELLRAA